MSYVQPIHASPELKPRDLDVEENVRTLVSAGAVFRQGAIIQTAMRRPTA
jgi:hypothetical protein